MSTALLHHRTRTSNSQGNKNVSWAEEWQWKEGEEEKIQAKKAAFKKNHRDLKRENMARRSRSPKEQAEWNIGKAEWMYSILTTIGDGDDDNDSTHQKIVKICNHHEPSLIALQNVMMTFGMGEVEVRDIESELRTFGQAEQGAEVC